MACPKGVLSALIHCLELIRGVLQRCHLQTWLSLSHVSPVLLAHTLNRSPLDTFQQGRHVQMFIPVSFHSTLPCVLSVSDLYLLTACLDSHSPFILIKLLLSRSSLQRKQSPVSAVGGVCSAKLLLSFEPWRRVASCALVSHSAALPYFIF